MDPHPTPPSVALRIFLTIDYSPWSAYSGGAQRSTDRLARALVARGHRVDVIYTRPPWERVATPQDLPYQLHWATLPALASRRAAPLRPLSGLWVRRRVDHLIDAAPPELAARPIILHANGEEGAFLPELARRRRIPLIATPRHPDYPPLFDHGWPTGAARLRLLLQDAKYLAQGRVARGADLIAPPSAYAARRCVRAFDLDPERVAPIFNGVDPIFFEGARDPHADAGPLLFFGRLEPDKGPLELLAAWQRLPAPRPRLIFIGRGRLESPLRRRIAQLTELGPIELLPWSDPRELRDQLTRAALVVLPSHRESFGNTIAEAMAVGAPVLACDVAAVPELLVHGERGWLTAPADPNALAAAITHLLADPPLRRRLGDAAATWARQQLRWEHAAARFEALYRRALARLAAP
ncbi:MAG: glycosyltransferase family 4 protein [Nannocystis sp.]|nr:glycosyltransferase family 4 protein [Nannocystis sp.]